MAVVGYPVVWTKRAQKDKDSISSYLHENWTEKELKQFFRKLEKKISLIRKNPEIAQLVAKTKHTRRTVLLHQITIYYEFKDERIEILSLFDTRQDPKKLNLG